MDDRLEVRVSAACATPRVSVRGELDLSTAGLLLERLDALDGTDCTLDVIGVSFVDVSGLRGLIRACGLPGVALDEASVSPALARLLELTRAQRLLLSEV
jgi:anti-anti-sigma factor